MDICCKYRWDGALAALWTRSSLFTCSNDKDWFILVELFKSSGVFKIYAKAFWLYNYIYCKLTQFLQLCHCVKEKFEYLWFNNNTNNKLACALHWLLMRSVLISGRFCPSRRPIYSSHISLGSEALVDEVRHLARERGVRFRLFLLSLFSFVHHESLKMTEARCRATSHEGLLCLTSFFFLAPLHRHHHHLSFRELWFAGTCPTVLQLL